MTCSFLFYAVIAFSSCLSFSRESFWLIIMPRSIWWQGSFMHDSSILAFQKVKQHHSHLLLRHVYYFFLCYQPKNDVCAQKGPWLVRWQSPMVAFFFFWWGRKKGSEYFSLFIVHKHKRVTVLRVREMNSKMNICSPKAFWKNWTNGQNLNFLLCLDDFPCRKLYFRIEIDSGKLHDSG